MPHRLRYRCVHAIALPQRAPKVLLAGKDRWNPVAAAKPS